MACCADMTLMIADMFGITGRRSELRALLADAERIATSQHGYLRNTVATSLADADHYLVVEEWRDQRRSRRTTHPSPSRD